MSGFLERLSQMIAPGSKQFDQNADRYVPGVVPQVPYQQGISDMDAYRLQLAKEAAIKNAAINQGLAAQFNQNADKYQPLQNSNQGMSDADLAMMRDRERMRNNPYTGGY